MISNFFAIDIFIQFAYKTGLVLHYLTIYQVIHQKHTAQVPEYRRHYKLMILPPWASSELNYRFLFTDFVFRTWCWIQVSSKATNPQILSIFGKEFCDIYIRLCFWSVKRGTHWLYGCFIVTLNHQSTVSKECFMDLL